MVEIMQVDLPFTECDLWYGLGSKKLHYSVPIHIYNRKYGGNII